MRLKIPGGDFYSLKYGGGWLDSLGSEILVGERYFWGSSEILIWTIVMG